MVNSSKFERELKKNYLKLDQVSKLLGINKTTIYKWIKKGLLPPPLKVGRRSYYTREFIESLFSYIEKEGKIDPFWWNK